MQEQNQVAKSNTQVKKAPASFKEMIGDERFASSLSNALPESYSTDKFISHCKTILIKVPKLADCTIPSLSKCLLDCASLGLYPDGRLAHLIPYKDQCTLILDYKGIVELVMRSGEVKNIHADVVCEHDEFEFNLGEVTKHVINFRKPRGEVYAVYCSATKSDNTKQFQVMTKEEVEKVRQSSRGKNSSPWSMHWNEMAKKTVFRRLSKWLPMCTESQAKLQEIEKEEFNNTIDMPTQPQKAQSDIL